MIHWKRFSTNDESWAKPPDTGGFERVNAVTQ